MLKCNKIFYVLGKDDSMRITDILFVAIICIDTSMARFVNMLMPDGETFTVLSIQIVLCLIIWRLHIYLIRNVNWIKSYFLHTDGLFKKEYDLESMANFLTIAEVLIFASFALKGFM